MSSHIQENILKQSMLNICKHESEEFNCSSNK